MKADPAFVTFEVMGKPEPAGSKRAVPNSRDWRSRPGVTWKVLDANPKSDRWKDLVAGCARAAMLKSGMSMIEGPCWMFLTFTLERPDGHFRKGGQLSAEGLRNEHHTKAPDVLKLTRAVEDALSGIVYKDDSLIISERMSKKYGPVPGVTITVTRV